MKELETIKTKISELENKKETLSTEIAELSQAVNDSFEDLLLGKVDDKTIDKAKELFESRTKELQQTEEYIQRAKAVRKKLAFEKVIPFAKEKRKKRTKQIQEKYDEQVEVVHEARKAFLQELAKLGKIRDEVGTVNNEYSQLLMDMGEEVSFYDKSVVNERKVHSPKDYTKEVDCLGLKTETQESVYASGNVPAFAKDGDSK